MIVVDIETSGLYPEKNGIWQIGAVEFNNPENTFLQEARIDDEDEVDSRSLEVIGKTEDYLRNSEKIFQKELLKRFFEWVKSVKIKNCVCQNPQFDLSFIFQKARKYDLEVPIHFRAFDTHSIAAVKYFQLNGKFLTKEENGASNMNLSSILRMCGMKDYRGAHNALEDAKLTAECLSRILNGESLFSEYSKFEIPERLKK